MNPTAPVKWMCRRLFSRIRGARAFGKILAIISTAPLCSPPPFHSPKTRRRCSSRISSAMLVRESRTSSANGAGAAIVGRMIGYVIDREFGYRLLLRYGSYVGLTTGRIKLGQYLFLRHGGKIIFAARVLDRPRIRTVARRRYRLARDHRRVGHCRRNNLCAPTRGSTNSASRARDARSAKVALGFPFAAAPRRQVRTPI